MCVIYIGAHACKPKLKEKFPDRKLVENIVRSRPTICSVEIQMEIVREALLSGKSAEDVSDVAMEFSNPRHIQYLKDSLNQKLIPGNSA